MMVAQPTSAPLSVEQYLEREDTAQVKHEYINGHLYAMSGGTIAHDLISNSIRASISVHLGRGPCLLLGPDVRLRVNESVYYYPDAIVTCEEQLDLSAAHIDTPRLIIEVLSNSTELRDRGDKFADYQTLDSFEEYLLIDSRRRAVEQYRRVETGQWTYRRYTTQQALTIETIAMNLPMDTLYLRTGF